MWTEEVLPRLRARGLGADIAVRTLRLAGIGESHVAEALGEAMLRAANPQVATYARPDAVDVRIVARPRSGSAAAPGLTAVEVLEAAERAVEERVGSHVFARDDETWTEALGARLGGRRVAAWERGTGGALATLLGFAPWFALDEFVGDAGPTSLRHPLDRFARDVRVRAGAEIGLAVEARERAGDTRVRIVIDGVGRARHRASTAFLGGEQGRRRAAVAACAALWEALGEPVRA
jgi:hypothetical protein